jgi:hypothetical protein
MVRLFLTTKRDVIGRRTGLLTSLSNRSHTRISILWIANLLLLHAHLANQELDI